MANITLGAGRQTFVFEHNGQRDTITDFRSLYFRASLDEAQEVPPNIDIPGIDGTGVGALNFSGTAFDFTLDINGIDLGGGAGPDDMTDMHIHGAPVGEIGPVIFDFLNDLETVIDPATGAVTGGWDANEADAFDMTPANLEALLAGDTYFNVHTNRDPAGFIRGQILQDGGVRDQIDVRTLNIGSFATIEAITRQSDGDALLRVFFDGEASRLRLDGVSESALRASYFRFAGREAETINGTGNRDDLFGAGGGDHLRGRADEDRLFGESGDDTIGAGRGRDKVWGGLGQDLLSGGAQADRFIYNRVADSDSDLAGPDRIRDFVAGLDKIVLRAIDAVAGAGGNQAFTFIGSDAFDDAGQVRVTQARGDTLVSLNTSGEGEREAVIRLDGLLGIGEGDLVL